MSTAILASLPDSMELQLDIGHFQTKNILCKNVCLHTITEARTMFSLKKKPSEINHSFSWDSFSSKMAFNRGQNFRFSFGWCPFVEIKNWNSSEIFQRKFNDSLNVKRKRQIHVHGKTLILERSLHVLVWYQTQQSTCFRLWFRQLVPCLPNVEANFTPKTCLKTTPKWILDASGVSSLLAILVKRQFH